MPLSLWLFTQLASGRAGRLESSLEGAINYMKRPFNATENHLLNEGLESHPSVSRLALISVGKSFESSVNDNESYTVNFKK